MDDNLPFISQDSSTSDYNYLSTWKIAVCQILALVIYGFAVFILSIDKLYILKQCDVIFLAFYFQAVLWTASLIIDHYYKWQHHILYLKGYFELYKQLSRWSSLTFVVISLFNTVFLIFGASLFFKFKIISSICSPEISAIPSISLNIIIAVEMLVLISLLVMYTVKVLKFNAAQPVADVRSVSFWIPENSSSVLEVGYRDRGEDMVDLLQKQADLIQYYKGKISFLNEKIMVLSHHSVDC